MILTSTYINSLLLTDLATNMDTYSQADYAKSREKATDNAVLSDSFSILTQLVAGHEK